MSSKNSKKKCCEKFKLGLCSNDKCPFPHVAEACVKIVKKDIKLFPNEVLLRKFDSKMPRFNSSSNPTYYEGHSDRDALRQLRNNGVGITRHGAQRIKERKINMRDIVNGSAPIVYNPTHERASVIVTALPYGARCSPQVDANGYTLNKFGHKVLSGTQMLEFHPSFTGRIIGKNGFMIKHIQSVSQCKVHLDNQKCLITISGVQENIAKASDTIKLLLAFGYSSIYSNKQKLCGDKDIEAYCNEQWRDVTCEMTSFKTENCENPQSGSDGSQAECIHDYAEEYNREGEKVQLLDIS